MGKIKTRERKDGKAKGVLVKTHGQNVKVSIDPVKSARIRKDSGATLRKTQAARP